MKVGDLSFIACRVVALYVLYQVLFNVLSLLTVSGAQGDLWTNFLDLKGRSIPFYASNIVLFSFLWFKADWVSKKVAGNRVDLEITAKLTVDDVRNVMFSALGVYILPNAFFSTSSHVIGHIYRPSNYDRFENIHYEMYTMLTVKWVFGGWLLLGSDSINKIIHKFRNW